MHFTFSDVTCSKNNKKKSYLNSLIAISFVSEEQILIFGEIGVILFFGSLLIKDNNYIGQIRGI